MILQNFKSIINVGSSKIQVPYPEQNPIIKTSAQDPDPEPLDPQDFGFLDPDPQKYVDPRFRIQGTKYQPKTAKKKLITKPKSELLKKREIIISDF